MAEKKIEQGQIWEIITDNFLTSGDNDYYKRPTKLLRGEKIEIRYPYVWHFRTEDDFYFHATPEMILENCKLFGNVYHNVRFNNKANLDEILRLTLYEKCK